MKNVLEYLEQNAIENGEKIAIIEEEKCSTYFELMKNSKSIGSKLTKYISAREPVAIIMEKGINTLYAFLGTVYAGGFYSLLNPELPNVRLEKILESLEAKVIITDEKNLELSEKLRTNQIIIKIEEIKNYPIDEEKLEEIRNKSLDLDPLYANFTSGSTGTPKGVIVGHRSVIDFIDIFTKKFDINDKDIIGNQAPFDFDVSVKDIYSSLKTGRNSCNYTKKIILKTSRTFRLYM